MEDDTVFSDDPVGMAARWVEAGARRLHLVDLDGAFAGKPKNGDVIKAICEAFPDLPVQIGGGIRNHETIQAYLDAGISYTIIGSQAVREPQFVKEACKQFAGHIIVGLDAKNGKVAVDGWAEVSELGAVELGKQFEDDGVESIVYTDISRDGMMQGVNVEATADLGSSVNIPVIASGGVANIDDIKALHARRADGIAGSILGRAIYEGTLDLAEAQAWVDAQ
jgi:phosphoribosylformimino-5-aminoimidazole carboxamide ribotide isomerase